MDPEGLFCFRERVYPLDWRSLNAVDIRRIRATSSLKELHTQVYGYTFALVDERDIADPLAVKLIRIFQFCIEYLFHIKKLDAQEMQRLEDEIWKLEKYV